MLHLSNVRRRGDFCREKVLAGAEIATKMVTGVSAWAVHTVTHLNPSVIDKTGLEGSD